MSKRNSEEFFEDIRQEGLKRAEESARGKPGALERLTIRGNSDKPDELADRINKANQSRMEEWM